MTSATSDSPGFNLSLLRCAAGTDVGMRREENQDCFGVIKRSEYQAFFIADGMGGAQGGATASRMAIATLQEALGAEGVRISVDFIEQVIQTTNARIFEKGSNDPAFAGMGTTLVGLIFTAEGVISVNVGDSRAYRIRHQNIEQISKDHTLLSELVATGALYLQDVPDHPVSHMLTRSLGPVGEVEVECKILAEQAENGDIYVLCSDGLYNYVPAEDILAVVRQNPLDDANQILINLANQRGGGDNITALVISVDERKGRGRKPTLPYPLIDIEEPPTESQAFQTEVDASEPEAKVPAPPPVEEPKDRKAQQRALRARRRVYAGSPRLMPTVLLLGITLLIGLALGGLVRRISFESFMSSQSYSPGGPIQTDPITTGDGLTLAALARQIRAERSLNQSDPAQANSLVAGEPEQLQAAISRLEQQVETLSKAKDTVIRVSLEAVQAEVDRLGREYSKIESNLDVASRAVTLWLSRQVALESQQKSFDSLSEVEQVAVYSGAIKDKLAALSSVSYKFRSKADEVELYPGNTTIRADLEQLQAKREQLRSELQIDVRKELGNILANAYKDYETVRIRRDMLWLDLQTAKRDLEIQGILSDNDLTKRTELLNALKERLENDRRILAEMQKRARSGR
jgi:serine/threonine protein phosphatase PrpC